MFHLKMWCSHENFGRSLYLAWLLCICTLIVSFSMGSTVFAQPAPKVVS